MKKLILGFLLSLGLTSALFAEVDLIALATNGAYNKQSKGVKVLSDEEMRQVVGGARLSGGSPEYSYGAANNSGARIYYTAYYGFYTNTSAERDAYRLLNVDDGSGRYYPVVSATLNHLNNQVSISIIGMNVYNPVYTRPADRYYANKILEDWNLRNQVSQQIKVDSTRFWNSQSRYR